MGQAPVCELSHGVLEGIARRPVVLGQEAGKPRDSEYNISAEEHPRSSFAAVQMQHPRQFISPVWILETGHQGRLEVTVKTFHFIADGKGLFDVEGYLGAVTGLATNLR